MDINLARLVFDMSANVANLQKDMSAANSAVQGAVGQMNAAIGTLKSALAGLGIAASAGAVLELGKSAVETAANMERMSQRTGVAVEALSAMRGAAKLSGTDMEAVAGTLQKLNKNMVEAQDPTTKAAQGFRALGVSVVDGTGHLRKQQDVVMDVAKAFAGSTQDANAYAAVTKAMGKNAQEVVPFLLELAEKGSLVGKITAEQAQQAHEFEKQMAQLKMTTEGYIRSGALELLPILTKLPGLFKIAAEAVAAYWLIFSALPAVFAAAMAAFEAYALRVYEGETLIGALVPATNAAILTIGPTWATLTAKFGVFQTAVMTGLGVLAAAFVGWQIGGWLRDNFLEAQLAAIAFVDGTLKAWEALKYGVGVAWAYIKDTGREALAGIGEYFADVLGAIAKGMEALGKTDAAKTLQGWSDSLRDATDNTGTLDTELADLRAGYEKATGDIEAITSAMADEAIASFKAKDAHDGHRTAINALGNEGTAKYRELRGELEKYMAVTAQMAAYIGREMPESAKHYAEELAKINNALKTHNITAAEAVRLTQLLKQATAGRAQVEGAEALEKIAKGQREYVIALVATSQQQQVEYDMLENGAQARAVVLEQLRIQQKLEADIRDIQRSSTMSQDQKDSAIATATATAELDKQNVVIKAGINARQQFYDASQQQARGLANSNEQLRLEIALMGVTDSERTRALEDLRIEQNLKEQLRQINLAIFKTEDDRNKAIADAQANAALEHQLAAVKQGLTDQKALMTDLVDLGKRMWTDFWSKGHDRLKALGQDIKTFLIDEIAKLAEKQLIIPIAAQIVGAIGGGVTGAIGSAAGSAAGSGLGSMLGGALSGGAGLGTGIMNGLSAWGSGGSVTGMFANAGLYSGAELLGAALPVLGGVLLAASALGAFKHGGPKTESGYGTGVPLRGDASGATSIAQAIQQEYAKAAGALGVNTQLSNLGVFYAQDPQGTAKTQLQIAGGNYSRSAVAGGIENVGRSDAEFQQAVALASAQLVVKNLQDAVKGPVGDFLRGIDITRASVEELQAAIATATNVGQFYEAVKAMGPQFSSLASLSVDAANGLLQLTGGLQGLMQLTDNYVNLFGTQSQQQQYLASKISGTLGKAGVTTSADAILGMTREQFTAWVDQAKAMGAAGATTYAALLSVATAFNQLHPALQQATADVQDNTAAVVDNSTALQDAYDAAKKATDAALEAVKRAVEAQKTQVQGQMDVTTAAISKLQGIFSYLQQQVLQLRMSVPGTAGGLAGQANDLINTAIKTGVMPDQTALGNAVSVLSQQVNQGQYKTMQDAELARLMLAGKLEKLQDVAGNQLTDAQKQLDVEKQQLAQLQAVEDAAQHQINELRGVDDSVKSVADAVKQLAAAITAEYNAKNAVSVAGAGAGGSGVLTGAPGTYGPSNGSLHVDANGNYIGADGSTLVTASAMKQTLATTKGLGDFATAYFDKYGLAPGINMYPDDATARAIGANTDALNAYIAANAPSAAAIQQASSLTSDPALVAKQQSWLPQFAAGTNYVPHDMVAMIHQGEAIVPKAFNPSAAGFSNSTAFVAYFQRMADRLDRMQTTMDRQTRHMQQVDDWVNGRKAPVRMKTVAEPGVVG